MCVCVNIFKQIDIFRSPTTSNRAACTFRSAGDIYLSIYQSIYLFVYLSIYIDTFKLICVCVNVIKQINIYRSLMIWKRAAFTFRSAGDIICLSIRLSIYLYRYIYIYVCVCVQISLKVLCSF